MTIVSIDRVVDFEHTEVRLSGKVAVLGAPNGDPATAYLVEADLAEETSRSPLRIYPRRGVWYLSVPWQRGAVTFCSQSAYVSVLEGTGDVSRVPFTDESALADLGDTLRHDAAFYRVQASFLEALIPAFVDIEVEHGLRIPFLDSVQEAAGRAGLHDGRNLLRDGDFEVRVDCDLIDFVECMDACEEDCAWWKFWCHGGCFLECLWKCATISGKGGA